MASVLALAAAATGSASSPGWANLQAPGLAEPPLRFAGWDAYDAGAMADHVAVGDFTGDGRQDVAMATAAYFDIPNDHKVFVFGQTASGSLAAPVRLDTHGRVDHYALVAGDVDGDGRPDLVVSSSSGIDLFLQRGAGLTPSRFIELPGAGSLALADLNADSRVDLVVSTSGGVMSLPGAGGGAFSSPKLVAPVPYPDAVYTEIKAGDVTGDGSVDVVGLWGGSVDVLAGRSDGSLADRIRSPLAVDYWRVGSSVAVGDFNGDGRGDVAVSVGGNGPGSRLNVFTQGQDGMLGPPAVLSSHDNARALLAADMNLDGRTDLVTGHGGRPWTGIYRQAVDGTLGAEELFPVAWGGNYPSTALAAGDFTGDGLPDVAVADWDAGLVVLRSAAQLQSWGLGYSGQLGIGSQATTATLTAHVPFADAVAVAAGGYHTIGLSRDGRISSWGLNHVGQLGIGSTTDRLSPTVVAGMTGVIAVAAGALHSLAVKADGTAWAWGWNSYGQLGTRTTTDRAVPALVTGLPKVTALAGGAAHSLALATDGSVWAWGLNQQGELGLGNATDSLVPVKVPGLTDVVAIAAGLYHNLALTRSGEVWAWGYNNTGQLGTGSTAPYDPVPQHVWRMPNATAISAGALHSVALSSVTDVWTWGSNVVGQLGDGSTEDMSVPDRADSLFGIRAVTAGWLHTMAVAADGTTSAWGWNHFGQLGNGTTKDALSPVTVPNLNPSVMAAGIAHSVALTARGQ